MTMLSLSGVSSFYGHIEALRGVDIEVNQGEIVTLIGANGAGKTTTLMTICGRPQARTGRVMFDGDDITGLATHEIIRRGIAHAPEGRRIFRRMTVLENLQIGAAVAQGTDFPRDLERVMQLFPRLADRQAQRAGTLSGGEQQMLAIGRALMARPSLLLLDEPSLGLAPKFITRIFLTLRELKKEGKTILLVEQNARQALQVADRGCVMERGRIILSGSGQDLLNMPEVQRTYLGQHAA